MATETTHLIYTDTREYGHLDTGEAKNLRQVLADIRAGRVHVGPVLIYTLIAVIGSFMFGYVLGYSSLTQISLSQDSKNATHSSSHVDMDFQLTDDEFSYFGALAPLTAVFGSLIMGLISDKIGRKPSMLISCLPLVFGWSIMAISYIFTHDIGDKPKFYAMLMVGRGLSGFGIGCLSLVVPIYIIEIAPTTLKGLLGATHQLAITIGNLVVYFVGSYLPYHYVAIIAAGIGVIYSVAILFIPETPRWLLVHSNQEKKAIQTLHKVRRCTYNINKEVQVLTRAVEVEGKLTFSDKVREFKKMPVIIALVLSVALMFFQQFCGINAIIFYGAKITASANIPNSNLAFSLGIGLVQVFVTFIGVILIDLAGRKKLLVSGGVLLLIGTTLLGICYILCLDVNHMHHYCRYNIISYVALAALVVFITGYAIGWGAIPWVLMSELAPSKVRGIMGGIVTAANWSFATIVILCFNDYQKAVHPYSAWWSFAFMVFLSIPVIFLLPETKGKTLEEIQKERNTWFKKLRINN